MTDKTDALRARELLAAEYTKRGMGVDFVNDAGTPTAIALAAIREALAAPAEGDGAVELLAAAVDEGKDHCGGGAHIRSGGTGTVSVATALRAISAALTRPSATAAVPTFDFDRARTLIGYVTGYCNATTLKTLSSDACMALRDLNAMLAAAPAAPKGGVVVVARELAEKVQDALGRFVGDEGWCGADMETADAFSAALANQEQRHDAIADGESASA